MSFLQGNVNDWPVCRLPAMAVTLWFTSNATDVTVVEVHMCTPKSVHALVSHFPNSTGLLFREVSNPLSTYDSGSVLH